MKGHVKKLLADKGFGFIQAENGTNYFFHRQDLLGDWEDIKHRFGNGSIIQVEFKPIDKSPKGPRAENVTVIE